MGTEHNRSGNRTKKSARPQNVRSHKSIDWTEINFSSDKSQIGDPGLEELSKTKTPARKKARPSQPVTEMATQSELTRQDIEDISNAVLRQAEQQKIAETDMAARPAVEEAAEIDDASGETFEPERTIEETAAPDEILEAAPAEKEPAAGVYSETDGSAGEGQDTSEQEQQKSVVGENREKTAPPRKSARPATMMRKSARSAGETALLTELAFSEQEQSRGGSVASLKATPADRSPRVRKATPAGRSTGYADGASRARAARPAQISYVAVPNREAFVPPVSQTPAVPVKKSSHRGLKIFGFTLGILLIVAGTVYAGISYYYKDHFIPGTTINGIDCSGMTAYQVEQQIASQYSDYSIKVASRGNMDQEITGSSIDYHYFSNGEILKLLQQQKPYTWLLGYFRPTSYTADTNITFDKELLQSQLKALECTKDENQESPQNAYVTLSGDNFTIVPETEGNELRVKEAYQMLDEAVAAGDTSVNFDSNPDAYMHAELTQDSPLIQAMLDAYNNYAAAKITYDFGNEQVVLDSDILKSWLEFDDQGQLISGEGTFEQHVRDFVAKLAERYDTVGTSRLFNATNGRQVYVYGSAYGWQIDQEAEVAELMDEITSGTQITRDPVYSMTANAHGVNDFGDTYIEVDMGSQHMYYYQNGVDIFESDFVSGDITTPGRATPEGVYTLYFKQSPAVLRGAAGPDGSPEYETGVTYWMPFNGGVGFHDADWQPYFGGDRFMGGGSHGCINLPYDSAATLYSIIDYGVPIICFY